MSEPGQSRSFGDVASMSELPSRAVVERMSVHGRKVPEAAVSSCNKEVAVVRLFNHFVSDGEQRRRYGQAKHARSRVVDDELELGRLLYRQVARLLAAKDTVDVRRRSSKYVEPIRPVAHKSADSWKIAPPVDRR